MAELRWSDIGKLNTSVPSVRSIDGMKKEIEEEIDKKFSYCRRIIGKAKWHGYFSSSRGKGETFGRWNKR